MPNETTVARLPYPAGNVLPNAPEEFRDLALAVEPFLVVAFDNAADRDARIVAPTSGQHAWLSDVELETVYRAGGWKLAGSGLNQPYGPGTPTSPAISGGAGTAQVVNTLTIPPAGWDRLLHIHAGCYMKPTADGDEVDIKILKDGVQPGSGAQSRWGTTANRPVTPLLSARAIPLASGVSTTLTLTIQRSSGSGTWGSSADPNLNYFDVLAVPA